MKKKISDKEKITGAFIKLAKKGYAAKYDLACLYDLERLKESKSTDKAVYVFEDDLAAVLDASGRLKEDLVITYEMESAKGLSRAMPIVNEMKIAGLNCEPFLESWEDSLIIKSEKRGRKVGSENKAAKKVQQ